MLCLLKELIDTHDGFKVIPIMGINVKIEYIIFISTIIFYIPYTVLF